MDYRVADQGKGGFCVADDYHKRMTQVWETREMAEDWLRRALSGDPLLKNIGVNERWHVVEVSVPPKRKTEAPDLSDPNA